MFNKYGLKGSSGLGKEYGNNNIFHITGSYGINKENQVFVKAFYKANFKSYRLYKTKIFHYQSWVRIEKEELIKKGGEIITCCKCNNPAVSLDHHYPYMIDFNLCKKHFKGKKKNYEKA